MWEGGGKAEQRKEGSETRMETGEGGTVWGGSRGGGEAGEQGEELSPHAVAWQAMGQKSGGRGFSPRDFPVEPRRLGHRSGWQCWGAGAGAPRYGGGGSGQGPRAGRAAHSGTSPWDAAPRVRRSFQPDPEPLGWALPEGPRDPGFAVLTPRHLCL